MRSALHMACMVHHLNTAELLITNGINVHLKDVSGKTFSDRKITVEFDDISMAECHTNDIDCCDRCHLPCRTQGSTCHLSLKTTVYSVERDCAIRAYYRIEIIIWIVQTTDLTIFIHTGREALSYIINHKIRNKLAESLVFMSALRHHKIKPLLVVLHHKIFRSNSRQLELRSVLKDVKGVDYRSVFNIEELRLKVISYLWSLISRRQICLMLSTCRHLPSS